MDSLLKLQEISLRLEQLESAGDWIARSLVHIDNVASHTGSLVTLLAEDVRERILNLVTEMEKETIEKNNQSDTRILN